MKSPPLRELFGKRAILAVRKILKTKILIDLKQRLVVAHPPHPRLGALAGAEKPESAALHFVVRRGIPQFVV
jgi:hypothetical protein